MFFLGFRKEKNFDSQRKGNSTFDWLPLSSAVCRLGSGRDPDIYIHQEYPINFFHEGYYATKKLFREYRVKNFCRDKRSFKSIYNLYLFDISNQRDDIAPQTLSVDFKNYPANVPTKLTKFTTLASVLTNRLVSKNPDGRRTNDLR